MSVAALALLASGCAGVGSGAPWHLELELTGGFAGLAEQFVVDESAGNFLVADDRRRVSASRRLSPDEVDELGRLVADLIGAESVDRRDGGCADCIRYAVTIRSAQRTHQAIYDSTTLGGAPEEALISRLIELGRAELAAARADAARQP